MSYQKIHIVIIISLLIIISCSPTIQVAEETKPLQKNSVTTDIHTAYAWFSSTAQSLGTLSNTKEPPSSIKNGLVQGLNLLPIDKFTFGLSKSELSVKFQNINSENVSELIAGTLFGLFIVNEYDRANTLIQRYCNHSNTINEVNQFIEQLTNSQFTNQFHKHIKLCN